jgi:hypothetical protein
MNIEKCPCCPNHCSKDNLGCKRGKEYFNNNLESNSIEENIIHDLRECGHLLHHNRETILKNFSNDELNELHKLLSKICNNFE